MFQVYFEVLHTEDFIYFYDRDLSYNNFTGDLPISLTSLENLTEL